MSVESVAAGLSVPRPTRRPLFKNSASGATPMPSCALMRGQLAMETSYSLSLATSWSSTYTPCTIITLSLSNAPQFST